MNKKLLCIALAIFAIHTNIDSRYGGGHGYHGRGGYGRGGYGHGWGGVGAGIATGAVVGTTVGLAASSGNRNSQPDPVEQAQADQMRYDMMQQHQNDQASNNDRYQGDSNNSRSQRIQDLRQQIADLESE